MAGLKQLPSRLPPVPASFVEFCLSINVRLTDAQLVLCTVAYDGVNPQNLRGANRRIADELFGGIDVVPDKARGVALHLCGARGGKSYILCALRLLHLALTVNLSSLAPGEIASALILAPKLKLARQTFRFALGAVEATPALACRLSNPTKETFVLQRETGRVVSVECLPASRGGDAVRARNYVGAVLDEFAFFRNDNFEVNDAELFQAVSPRIMLGGQLVLASTAWARMGMHHDLFKANFGHPGTCLASRAPTVLLNPSKRAQVAIEVERDPMNAAREFGCEFMDAAAATFFSHDAIDSAIDAKLELPLTPPAGAQVMIGADTGFRRDSSALVVVYLLLDKTMVVAEILELRPRIGEPLKPSQVVEAFALACKRHGCSWLMADGHYRETLDEELQKHGLSYVPAPGGAEGKAATHMQMKTVLHQGRLTIPNHRRLIEQMKTLIGKPTSGGGMTFTSPRTTAGGHGDILSALVLAASQRSGQVVNAVAEVALTVEEVIKKESRERVERYEKQRQDALADGNDWTGREKILPDRQETDFDVGFSGMGRQPWYVQ